MRKFRLFIGAVFSEWGSGLSGPASVPFAILALWASGSVQKVAYGSLAAILGFFSAYRVWLKEHNAKLSANLDAETVRREYLDEVPQLGMKATILSGAPQSGQIGATSLDVEFRFRHLSGRPATSLSVQPITSSSGTFTLYIGSLPHIARGEEEKVDFEVWRLGQRPSSKLLSAIGWGKMLADFLWDSRAEGNPVAFLVIVGFRDRDEYRHQRFRLIFDRTAYRFDVVDEVCDAKTVDRSPIGTLPAAADRSRFLLAGKKAPTFSTLMGSLKHVKSSGPYTRDEMNER